MKPRWRRFAKGLTGAAFFLILLALVYCYAIVSHAHKNSKTIISARLTSSDMVLKATDLTAERKRMLLLVQDPGFSSHRGVDFSTPGNGLTTLTQAIVKKLYFSKFKPGFLKLKQSLIARFVLPTYLTKDEQITIFLNVMWFNKGVVGFEAAAKHFFKKSFIKLAHREFLALLAMVINPNTFHLLKHPGRNQNRVAAIERLISGNYKPKSLMDLYYGGNTYRPKKAGIKGWLDSLIWGY